MKFWQRLRWISTAAFAALLLWSWWVGDITPSADPSGVPNRSLTF